MGTRSGKADSLSGGMDVDLAGRSTSTTSSSRLRDSRSPPAGNQHQAGRGRTRSRSRSRSPKRPRYEQKSGDHGYRDRDRGQYFRAGSNEHSASHDSSGRERDTRRNQDDREISKNLKKNKEEDLSASSSSKRQHRHHGSHDHGHDHRRHRRHHSQHDKDEDKIRLSRQRQKKRHPKSEAAVPIPDTLPFGSRALDRKSDQMAFEPLFSYYLDLHKSLDISQLPPDEVRGRWKSFVNKWNRGELAEGWYDPELFQRVAEEWRDAERFAGESGGEEVAGGEGEKDMTITDTDEFGRVRRKHGQSGGDENRALQSPGDHDGDPGAQDLDSDSDSGSNRQHNFDEDDDYGPALPPAQRWAGAAYRHGPEAPTLQDLTLRNEFELEARQAEIEALRQARKEDRRVQKERLDELVPRADAGTRERKLEKKKLVNEKMRGFRERSPGAAEVPEEDLMGGGEGGAGSLEEQKRRLAIHQAKVSERQLRREAIERAQAAEREERIRGFREREERAVEKLRELAKRRFGGGGGGGTGSVTSFGQGIGSGRGTARS